MRAFLGIPLPDDIRDALVAARRALLSVDDTWRDQKWVAPENLHITLKFLGDVTPDEPDALAQKLVRALDGSSSIPLRLAGVRAVPTPRRARMLWAEFADDTDELTSLARVTDRLAAQIGVEPDTRPYAPHATLARARKPQAISGGAVDAANAEIGSHLGKEPFMSVRHVIVYESTLTRSGPIYSEHAIVDVGPAD